VEFKEQWLSWMAVNVVPTPLSNHRTDKQISGWNAFFEPVTFTQPIKKLPVVMEHESSYPSSQKSATEYYLDSV
jgi:hypothetical protein